MEIDKLLNIQLFSDIVGSISKIKINSKGLGGQKDKMEKKIFVWEPWFFMFFGLFHLHRIWGLIDRNSYARFWIKVLENKSLFYFILMGFLILLCTLGIITFFRNRHSNYWWRWIYLFGGIYVLFDLFAIAINLKLWNRLLLWMFDVNSPYWNMIWIFFIIMGGCVFVLGIKLLIQRGSHLMNRNINKIRNSGL